MHLLKKKSAIKTFYYLMAVDDDVSPEELKCFDEIGNEIDPVSFAEYRETVITECEHQLKSAVDEDDHFEVVLEGTDRTLTEQTDDVSSGVSSRLLIWDMLVIAFSNDHYDDFERRFIKHIVRTMEIDQSVFLEMEQLMKTNISVGKELAWIKTSDRTYAEIAPIVTELENRRTVIMTCAKTLIEDELYTATEKVQIPQNNAFERAKAKVAPAAAEIGGKMTKFADNAKTKIGQATAPMANELGKQTQKLFSGIKSWKKNGTNEKSAEKDEITQVNDKPGEG